MCKYCDDENNYNPIMRKSSKFFGSEFTFYLSLIPSSQILSFSVDANCTEIISDINAKIKYCPMCGRKL
jgi:hypothetical protein